MQKWLKENVLYLIKKGCKARGKLSQMLRKLFGTQLYTSSFGSSVPFEEGAAQAWASEASSCGVEEDAFPTAGVAGASPL